MARLKDPRKWTKARIKKMLTTKKANAILRAATQTAFPAKRGRASVKKVLDSPNVVAAHYVGEIAQAPAVDVGKLEERAFRRGMFTALQVVVDVLIRELR
jgi:hypothetical protein